ncbi:type II toxin-antitoxin system RelE/ParE family toxin [Lactobacillus helveticus]|nr:type II toxin-antitoxin system RelE/ParE family toxin [Lactobacillus helveticus]
MLSEKENNVQKKLKFEMYERLNGHNEFYEYLNSLTVKEQAKLLSLIKQVELNGISVAVQQHWIGVIDSDIFELRARFSNKRMRGLYFHVDDGKYVITHGFSKTTKKMPLRENKHAHDIRNEYYERKNYE